MTYTFPVKSLIRGFGGLNEQNDDFSAKYTLFLLFRVNPQDKKIDFSEIFRINAPFPQ